MSLKGKFVYIIGVSKNVYIAKIIGTTETESNNGFYLTLEPIGSNTKKGNIGRVPEGFRPGSTMQWYYNDKSHNGSIFFKFFDSEEELMAYYVENHLQE